MMTPPPPELLAQRPPMPTSEDQVRSTHQLSRLSLLLENWDQLAADWNEKRVGVDRSALQGLPDTSSNILADMARQLSTPGLYGERPKSGHVEPFAQALVGPGGFMDRARYWLLMQHIQYITTGLSDMFVALDVSERELAAEPVYPHDVQLVWHPRKPGVIVGLWRLRLRYLPAPFNAWVWAWDQWSLGERDTDEDGATIETAPPSFAIVGASGDWKGKPLTNLLVKGAPAEGYVGDAYRWRFADDSPFIPYVRYVDVDTGGGWNWTHRRGAMRGAMKTQEFWTYASHAAQDASGRTVIAAGLEPMGTDVQDAGTKDKVRTIQLRPGSILYHQTLGDAQPFVQEVGPGANVRELLDYAERYEARQLRRWGIDTAGAEKTSSDPTSGAAKFVSRQQKREIAARVKPLYEASDLHAIRVCAALLRIAGVATFPEQGYSIAYAQIAMSAEELAAEREDVDWLEEKGQISRVEAYKRRHPGASDADAKVALVRAAVENAELDRAIQDELAARGLGEDTVDTEDEIEAALEELDSAEPDLDAVRGSLEAMRGGGQRGG